MSALDASPLTGWLDDWLAREEPDLVAVRRRLHAHPELGHGEHRTTAYLRERLAAAGLEPRPLPSGTGLVVEVGGGDGGTTGSGGGRVVGLRADLDALPLDDPKDVPYRSTVAGVCHACGHDAHTAMLLGAALALADGPALPGRVRCLFQPAEELTPGGALGVIEAGALDGLDCVYALHCDPALDVGQVGVRPGALTAAADKIEVRLDGPGGHTARPHQTVDLVHALGRVVVQVPELLSRRVDPRAGLSVVWGAVHAGAAPNAIPGTGVLAGTLRVLDREAWEAAPALVREIIDAVLAPTGGTATVNYVRGVPPVVNDPVATRVLRSATAAALGQAAVVDTRQSLGGEDFAWYLEHVPGALARLGVRGEPHDGPLVDLHQGGFDIDERALGIGVRVLVHAAHAALAR